MLFVESEADALSLAKENYEKVKSEFELSEAEFFLMKINDFTANCDLVIQNPPFGTKLKHADKEFLEKAFSLAPIVYSFHKESTKEFVEKLALKHGFNATHHWKYNFPIKAMHKFHTRKIHRISVGVWRFEREA